MDKSQQPGGIGCFTVLLIVFVVLKLAGLVAWSWLWVLSPLWIPLALVVAILSVVAVVALIMRDRS